MAPIKSAGSSPTPIAATSNPTPAAAPAKSPEAAPKPAANGEIHHWTKDGYIDIKPSGGLPASIKLQDGSTASVQRTTLNGTEAFTLKGGKTDLLVQWTPKGWQFYRPAMDLENTSNVGATGKGYVKMGEPTTRGNTPAERAFVESAEIVGGRQKADPMSPADRAAAAKAVDRAAAPKAAEAVDALSKSVGAARKTVQDKAANLAKAVDQLPIALQKGVVVTSRNPEQRNEITFELTPRPPSMSLKEYGDLQREFGDKLSNATNATRIAERELGSAQDTRRHQAAALYEQINSGPFIAHLESLPPTERLAKVNELATSLQGTPQGRMLADDLMAGSPGQEHPSALGRAVFKGASEDPKARAQLTGLGLNLASQMTVKYGRGESLVRATELAAGRPLTEEERVSAIKLGNMSPAQFEKEAVKGFEQFSDVSQALSLLGQGLEGKLGKAGGFSSGFAKVGAAAFAGYQLYRTVSDIANNGLTKGNAVTLVEDSARAVNNAVELMKLVGNTRFAQIGKLAGATSDGIGFLKDLVDLAGANDTNRHDKMVNAMAGGLIFFGGLAAASTPVGLAAGAVGTAVKLLAPKKSDDYVEFREILKEATTTAEERETRAAQQKAADQREIRRRETREVGNRI